MVSTPAVWPCSGWPGVLLPQVRSDFRSSSSRPKPAEEELGVEGDAAVPGGQHEPVAAHPVRVGGVVPHRLLEERVGRRAPGSSPCRGGRCRPSARRPWPAPGRCPRPAGPGRSMSSLLTSVRSSQRSAGRCGSVPVQGHAGPRWRAYSASVSRTHTVPRLPACPGQAVRPTRLDPVRCASPTTCPADRPEVRVTAVDPHVSVPARGLPGPPTVARRARRLRRADEAADHRAAAADHRAGDVPRPARRARRSAWWWPPCVGGTLSAGSANALNCVYDADIDERMRRTRRRALPRHMVTHPGRAGLRAGARGRLHAVAGAAGQLALRRAGAGGERVLRRRLHDDPQAPHHPEHRLGRRGRLLPGADRLDRGDRLAGLGAGGAVPGGVLLDAAALLGAGDPLPRGLRRRRRADAAGRGRARRPWPGRSSPTPT